MREKYGENTKREKLVGTRSASRSIQHLSLLFPSPPTRAEGIRELEPKIAVWAGEKTISTLARP